jgi:hypothetical protein
VCCEKNAGIGLSIAQVNHGLWPIEVEFRRVDVNEAVRIAGGHVADTANRNDDGVIGGAEHGLEVFERGNFLEELRLGFDAQLIEARSGDLKMKRSSIGRFAFNQKR